MSLFFVQNTINQITVEIWVSPQLRGRPLELLWTASKERAVAHGDDDGRVHFDFLFLFFEFVI